MPYPTDRVPGPRCVQTAESLHVVPLTVATATGLAPSRKTLASGTTVSTGSTTGLPPADPPAASFPQLFRRRPARVMPVPAHQHNMVGHDTAPVPACRYGAWKAPMVSSSMAALLHAWVGCARNSDALSSGG